jgi:hypothetical protein
MSRQNATEMQLDDLSYYVNRILESQDTKFDGQATDSLIDGYFKGIKVTLKSMYYRFSNPVWYSIDKFYALDTIKKFREFAEEWLTTVDITNLETFQKNLKKCITTFLNRRS